MNASNEQRPASYATWIDGWHVVPHHVLFRDLDPFGHVNNAVFFTYFEWGRTQLWFELTGTNNPRDIAFIVARAECDFRQQLGIEPIEIRTRIGEMRTSSFDFLSEIRRSDGQIAASGKVVVVHFDWERQAKAPISEQLRRKVAGHAEHALGTRTDSSRSGAAAVRGDRGAS